MKQPHDDGDGIRLLTFVVYFLVMQQLTGMTMNNLDSFPLCCNL